MQAESLATAWAEDGVPKGRAAVAPRGETVVQRADRFTNYAGTFLYVEAYSKADGLHGRHDLQRSDAGDVVRGRRRRLRRGDRSAALHRHHHHAGHVQFHRLLVRLTGADAQIPVAQT